MVAQMLILEYFIFIWNKWVYFYKKHIDIGYYGSNQCLVSINTFCVLEEKN